MTLSLTLASPVGSIPSQSRFFSIIPDSQESLNSVAFCTVCCLVACWFRKRSGLTLQARIYTAELSKLYFFVTLCFVLLLLKFFVQESSSKNTVVATMLRSVGFGVSHPTYMKKGHPDWTPILP